MAAGATVEISQSSDGDQSPEKRQIRQTLVQRLTAPSPSLPAFLHDLITQQAITVAGTEAAGFMIEAGQQPNELNLKPVAHIRPDNATPEIRQSALEAFKKIIGPCVVQDKNGVFEIGPPDQSNEMQFCLVTLLRSEGKSVAVSAVVTRCLDVERAQQRLQAMEVVAGYMELYSLRRSTEQARAVAQNHQHVLQLSTAVATSSGFQSACMNLCNELASRTKAARVSLGWLKGYNIKLKAMSHTEEFDKRQELAVAIVKTMEECRDQEEIVHYEPGSENVVDGQPRQGSNNVTRFAAELSRISGGHSIISLPLRRAEDIVGVMTLEFGVQTRLGTQASTALAVAAELLAPQLYDRYQNDRWLITKAGISTLDLTKKTVGPKYMITKLIVLLVIGLVAAGWLYKPMYRVTSPFAFQSEERRSVVAPFEGQIKKVFVFPGDVVKTGDKLIEMDVLQKQQQLTSYQANARAKRMEASSLQAQGKQSEYKVALAEAEAIDADVAKTKTEIDQATIRATIDGQVLQGDLRDQQGAIVGLGKELIVVGTISPLRVELTLAERDAQTVKVNYRGMLATTAEPNARFPFIVERIGEQTVAEAGSNVYKIYARLDRDSKDWPTDPATKQKLDPAWRPGMQGESRIDIEPKPVAWIWTHRLVEFVRLKLWI